MASKKVRLVLQRAFTEIPSTRDVFSQAVTVQLPDGFDEVKLVGARVYGAYHERSIEPGYPASDGDINSAILDYKDVQNLVGKLLTYVDATYSDQEQRKAHKDIVRNAVYEWERTLRERAVQLVDFNEPAKDGSTNE
jgi:hypothetical protein